ncbi:MAG: hypothetical protein R3F11_03075 [Verrucomicrobiales bacterium]
MRASPLAADDRQDAEATLRSGVHVSHGVVQLSDLAEPLHAGQRLPGGRSALPAPRG